MPKQPGPLRFDKLVRLDRPCGAQVRLWGGKGCCEDDGEGEKKRGHDATDLPTMAFHYGGTLAMHTLIATPLLGLACEAFVGPM